MPKVAVIKAQRIAGLAAWEYIVALEDGSVSPTLTEAQALQFAAEHGLADPAAWLQRSRQHADEHAAWLLGG